MSNKSKKHVKLSLFFLVFCLLVLGWGKSFIFLAHAQDRLKLPEAQRMYGFAAFVSAYQYALEGKIDEALKKLEVAIKWDPYLVEYYLLKAFCMYNLGRFDDAITNLNFYLEVRNKDFFARSFLEEVKEKKTYVKDAITKGIPVNQVLLSDSFVLWKGLGVSPIERFIPYMPGRPVYFGENLIFTDQLRGKMYLYQRDVQKRTWGKKQVFDVGKGILKAIPLSAQEFVLLFHGGLLKIARWNQDTERLEDVYEANLDLPCPYDGAYLGDGIIGVSDRVRGKVSFIKVSTGEEVYSWFPSDAKNFEPVTLAVYGPILAVADMSSKSVYLLDLVSKKLLNKFTLESPPRAVELFNSSEGVVLTEEGSLYRISVLTGQAEILAKKLFPEAWFLFSMDGKIYATDTRLFRASALKLVAKKGYLVMKDPSRKGDFWEVDARIVVPFGRVELGSIVLQGAIEGQLADVEVLEKKESPEPIVRIDKSLSLRDKDLEVLASEASVLVVKSSALPQDKASLIRLGNFALARGIKIFITSDSTVPDVAKVHLAELTGGGLMNVGSLMPSAGVMKLKISSVNVPDVPGSRDDSGLLILGRVGLTKVEGRLPFWSVFIQF